jgi:hypothetical protein
MKPSDFLTELSNDKLTQYKTAAAADASKADKEGDFKKGDKRFSGIVKATKKQFDNDAKKDVAEGWKEGVGYTVLAGLLSLGAINRLSDLVNSAVTGEPTQSFLNRNSGINKLNDIKTTTGQGIESIKSVSSGGDKKFEMMLSDGRKVRFTTTDLERAKKIAAARQASEPVEVKEQGVAENVAGDVNSKKRYHFLYPHVPLDMHTDHEYNDLSDRDLQAVKSHQRELAYKLGKPGAEEQSDIASHIQINRARSQYDQEQAHRRKVLDAEKIKRQARDAKRQQGVAEGLGNWIKNKFDPNNIPGFTEYYPGIKSHVVKDIVERMPRDKFGAPDYPTVWDRGWLLDDEAHRESIKDSMENYLIKKLGNEQASIFVKNNKKLMNAMNDMLAQDIDKELENILKRFKEGVAEADIIGFRRSADAISKQKVWQSSAASDSKQDDKTFSYQGYTINFTPDKLNIYLGGDLVLSRKGNFANPTKMQLVAARGNIGKIIDDKRRAALIRSVIQKNKGIQGVAEEKCPHCNGPMVSEELMNEKKDACYYKVKSRYKVWPSAYASGALVKCRKKGADSWGNGSKNESSILEGIEQADESLHDWFNKEKWVRMDTKGNIKGPCAKEPGEGKPKCLPQAKAHSLGKKGRASAAARKRREDPNPDRSGKAINVNTKKTKG